MTGLDDVEEVLARPVHDGSDNSETDQAAPEGRTCLKAGIAQGADPEPDPGTRSCRQDIGQRDPEIDRHPKHDERQGLHHQTHRPANTKIPHAFSGYARSRLASFLKVSRL